MKKKSWIPGYGKVLEAWVPPHGAGDPVGCVATSFTFSPVFFEEECLSRFLSLDTDPVADGPVYLVEREEKLSSVACAAALVDQNHARGSRSLRWDLLSARVPGGILHAKVSLLYWANLVRLIVSSANLTGDGYRRNREIFGVLDYHEDGEAPLSCLVDAVAFLKEAARYTAAGAEGGSPAVSRWNGFLDQVLEVTRDWGSTGDFIGRKKVRVHALFAGPGYRDAFARLKEVWPGSSPPKRARVTCPFFDPPGSPNEPAKAVWTLLNRRGEAGVTYAIPADEVDGGNVLLFHGPESLGKAQPRGRRGVSTVFRRVREDAEPGGGTGDFRPLHLKSMWLENEAWAAYMIGSSNFTSAGMGLKKRPNLEANLVYCVSPSGNRRAYRMLCNGSLDGEKIGGDVELRWQPRPDEGEDSPSGAVLLPLFFGDAVYRWDEEGGARVTLTIEPGCTPPHGWVVRLEDDSGLFYSERAWREGGSPGEATLTWRKSQPPSGFEVVWDGAAGPAWWPVNVESAAALPPPSELRNLPLEVLISILTSARPLHQVLRNWLRRGVSGVIADGVPVIDPHKRVDTSSFLLRRTRRVSWALSALRERLERPVLTMEVLSWRLRGPVGVLALARAIMREARDESEKPFLLAELALELSRVKPERAPGCLDPREVTGEIENVIGELRAYVDVRTLEPLPELRRYVEDAFEAAMR